MKRYVIRVKYHTFASQQLTIVKAADPVEALKIASSIIPIRRERGDTLECLGSVYQEVE